MNEDVFHSRTYVQSKYAYIFFCGFEYFVTLLMNDSFLARLLSSMGLSDDTIGVVSSIISMAFLFQLLTLLLMKRLKNVKKLVIVGECGSLLFFGAVYLLPLTGFSVQAKTVLVFVLITAGYFSKYLVSSILYKWANSYVSPNKRAAFSGFKEMTSVLAGIGITLSAGLLMDHYTDTGRLEGAFIIIAATILFFDLLCFISLLLVKDGTVTSGDTRKQSMKSVFRNTLGNAAYRKMVLMTTIADAPRFLAVSFFGTYKNKELMMNMSLVSVVNIIGSVMYVLFAQPMGRYADKTSYARGLRLCNTFALAAFAVAIFCVPSTWYLMIVFQVLFGIHNAGKYANTNNIIYSYADQEYFVQAMSIRSAISGIFGFLCALLGGKLLSSVQTAGNQIFGVPVYGQQVLSLLSAALLIFSIFYDKFVLEKQKILVQ